MRTESYYCKQTFLTTESWTQILRFANHYISANSNISLQILPIPSDLSCYPHLLYLFYFGEIHSCLFLFLLSILRLHALSNITFLWVKWVLDWITNRTRMLGNNSNSTFSLCFIPYTETSMFSGPTCLQNQLLTILSKTTQLKENFDAGIWRMTSKRKLMLRF